MVDIFNFFDPAITIFLIAFFYYLLYSLVVKFLVDKEKIKQINQKSKDLQLQISQASKEKDEKKLEELSKEYEKLIPELFSISFMQLKPLIPLIPILIFLSSWLKQTYNNFVIKLPFSLPIFIQNLDRFPNWRDTFGPIGWFWLSVIFISLFISIAKYFINNFKNLNEKIKISNLLVSNKVKGDENDTKK
ncbi:MAG: EMC3/TMCO1 family protein [Candidatus Anstonellaceae archaeon]